jgi:hypothetical protein
MFITLSTVLLRTPCFIAPEWKWQRGGRSADARIQLPKNNPPDEIKPFAALRANGELRLTQFHALDPRLRRG